jgi:hypothetical protein
MIAKVRIPVKVMLLSGALVGTLDILSALIYTYLLTGKNPVRVFPYIASGVFGKKALSGDRSMIIAGLLFHYLIAFIFTIVFFLLYPQLKRYFKNWIVLGVIYGVAIWCIMNLIVVPLSNTPPPTWKPVRMFINMLILIAAIGLPLSFIARRSYIVNR